MTEVVNLNFHIIKIFNFRHKIAFKRVVSFLSPSVYVVDFKVGLSIEKI